MENKEPIELDSANNVFVGPDEYFKVVIDDFDGETVKAWHIEDSLGNSTGNLVRGEGKHIDALVGKNNRTVWHFANRVAANIIAQEQAQLKELQAQLEELQAKMGEMEK